MASGTLVVIACCITVSNAKIISPGKVFVKLLFSVEAHIAAFSLPLREAFL